MKPLIDKALAAKIQALPDTQKDKEATEHVAPTLCHHATRQANLTGGLLQENQVSDYPTLSEADENEEDAVEAPTPAAERLVDSEDEDDFEAEFTQPKTQRKAQEIRLMLSDDEEEVRSFHSGFRHSITDVSIQV
jgi:hypothetical protein